jgi:RimJ/RimL family protein N-acetyltransferase
MKIIKGKNFILRPLRLSDAKSIAANANDRGVSRGMAAMPFPYTVEMAKKWVRRAINQGRRKHGCIYRWAIEIDGEAVGIITLHSQKTEWHKHCAELGYWLGKEYWRRGTMTSAVGETIKYGFNQLGFQRIYATVFPFNKASMRVLEKNNFKLEGVLKKNAKKGTRLLDHYLYAKVK